MWMYVCACMCVSHFLICAWISHYRVDIHKYINRYPHTYIPAYISDFPAPPPTTTVPQQMHGLVKVRSAKALVAVCERCQSQPQRLAQRYFLVFSLRLLLLLLLLLLVVVVVADVVVDVEGGNTMTIRLLMTSEWWIPWSSSVGLSWLLLSEMSEVWTLWTVGP